MKELTLPRTEGHREALVDGKIPVLAYYEEYRQVFNGHLARPRQLGPGWDADEVTWETNLPGEVHTVTPDHLTSMIRPELERLEVELKRRVEKLRRDPDEVDRAKVFEAFTFPPLDPRYFFLVGGTWVMAGWGLADGPITIRPSAHAPHLNDRSRGAEAAKTHRGPGQSALGTGNAGGGGTGSKSSEPVPLNSSDSGDGEAPGGGSSWEEGIEEDAQPIGDWDSEVSSTEPPLPVSPHEREPLAEETDGSEEGLEPDGSDPDAVEDTEVVRPWYKRWPWNALLAVVALLLLLWFLVALMDGCGGGPAVGTTTSQQEVAPREYVGGVEESTAAENEPGARQRDGAPPANMPNAPAQSGNTRAQSGVVPPSSAFDSDEPASPPPRITSPSSASELEPPREDSGIPSNGGTTPLPDASALPPPSSENGGDPSLLERIEGAWDKLFGMSEGVPAGEQAPVGVVYYVQRDGVRYLILEDRSGQRYILESQPLE